MTYLILIGILVYFLVLPFVTTLTDSFGIGIAWPVFLVAFFLRSVVKAIIYGFTGKL